MEPLSLFGEPEGSEEKGKEKEKGTPLSPHPHPHPHPYPSSATAPLAYRLAPRTFQEYVGQSHLLAPDQPLRRLIEADKLVSMVVWGPPGCGKTSLARLISVQTKANFVALNAVTAKIADIKAVVDTAKLNRQRGLRTVLFIDEIHRFNKVQQDALLPDVENGTLTFIGATTENPFFSVIPSLLSRAQIFELKPLSTEEKRVLIDRACQQVELTLSQDQKELVIRKSGGDARQLLNKIELLTGIKDVSGTVSDDAVTQILGFLAKGYSEDDHYHFISAFIKSMRGSDPDAALYWMSRMLLAGEDPVFIARRMVIFASEDVGNADPQALSMAVAAMQAAQWIGMPEIRINFAQVVTYLACAPKSNAAYLAVGEAFETIQKGILYEVPDYLKSSSYKGATTLGYGKGYLYPHDAPDGVVKQDYLPSPHTFYKPKAVGFETELQKRLRVIGIQKQHS